MSDDVRIKFELHDDTPQNQGGASSNLPPPNNNALPEDSLPTGTSTDPIEAERAYSGLAAMAENAGFGGMAAGIEAATGPVGIAMAALTATVFVTKVAFEALTQRVEDSIAAMAPFSGQIQAAQSQAEVRMMQAMFRRDAAVGSASVDFINQQSRFDVALADLETSVQSWLTPFMTEIMSTLADIAELASDLMDFVNEVIPPELRKELVKIIAMLATGVLGQIAKELNKMNKDDAKAVDDVNNMLVFFKRQTIQPRAPVVPPRNLPAGVF